MRCFGVEVDPASHSASVDGRPVSLAKTEYEMLRVLVRANGRAVSKLEIECSVWGADMPADGTFKTHVHRLRKAIGADRLATVRGQGYALQPKPCVNRGLRGLL